MNIVDMYCRVAAASAEALAEQETACRQFAEARGLTVAMVHRDTGSGLNLERLGLSTLRARYTSGAIQGVVVVRLDRLSRSPEHKAMLVAEMRAHGVGLHCVDEDVTDTLQVELTSKILEWAANAQR